MERSFLFLKRFYLCRDALILSGNNNWPPVIDLIGGFFYEKKLNIFKIIVIAI